MNLSAYLQALAEKAGQNLDDESTAIKSAQQIALDRIKAQNDPNFVGPVETDSLPAEQKVTQMAGGQAMGSLGEVAGAEDAAAGLMPKLKSMLGLSAEATPQEVSAAITPSADQTALATSTQANSVAADKAARFAQQLADLKASRLAKYRGQR